MSKHDLEERLSASLHHRADALHGASLTLDDVRRRATSIRRRRRVATGAGLVAAAAVVAAVAVPTASLWQGSEQLPPAAPPSTPGVAWWDQGSSTVHRPDGSTVEVDPGGTVHDLTVLSDGRVVFVVAGQDSVQQPATDIVVTDPSGTPTGQTYDAYGYDLAVNTAQTAAGWVGPDGTPMVVETGTGDPVALAAVPELAGKEARVDHLTGSNCDSPSRDGADHCAAIVTGKVSPSTWRSWLSDNFNTVADPFADQVAAVAPDGDHYISHTSLSEGGPEDACGALWARSMFGGEADPAPLATTCGYNSYDFSPDGSLVAARYGEGYGPTSVDILDATTLEVVASTSDPGLAYHDVVWEDASHVLLLVDRNQRAMQSGEYQVQRLDVTTGEMDRLDLEVSRLASR